MNIVTLCYNCKKIDIVTLETKQCSCSGELKYLKCFNNKKEAENYAKYLRGEFKFVNQT